MVLFLQTKLRLVRTQCLLGLSIPCKRIESEFCQHFRLPYLASFFLKMKKFVGFEYDTPIYTALLCLKHTSFEFYWQRDLLKWFFKTYLRQRISDKYFYKNRLHTAEIEMYKSVMEHSKCCIKTEPEVFCYYEYNHLYNKRRANPVFNMVCAFVECGMNVHIADHRFDVTHMITEASFRLNHKNKSLDTLMICESSQGFLHYGRLKDWEMTKFHLIISLDPTIEWEIDHYMEIYHDTCVLRVIKEGVNYVGY